MTQAKEAAANALPGAAPPAIATATAPASAPVAYAAPQKLSIHDVAATARKKVDHYVKVGEHGITIGKQPQLMSPADKIAVSLVVDEANLFWSLRIGTDYKRSLDRVSEDATGQPWPTVVAQGRAVDPKCKGDYKAAEVFMILEQDVLGKKGEVLAKKGEFIAYTTSITGFDPFQQLAAACSKTGNLYNRIAGHLQHQFIDRNNNQWGIILFENFEPVSTEAEVAAA